MKFNTVKTIFFTLTVLVFFSCTKNNDVQIDPLTGYTKLEEGYAIGASTKVELWGQKNFFMGFNNLIIVLYDSVNPTVKITDAKIQFKPLMTMSMNGATIQHASPVENPDQGAINNVFPGAVTFIMPSSMGNTWQLGINVQNNENKKQGTATFDVSVDSPDPSVLKVFTTISSDANTLIIALLKPAEPKVGMNDIEFAVYKKVSMMSFPPDDSYTIEITPEMPSMGHGSPNNQNPVDIGNGHYKGKVNFTMTGEWRVNVVVKKDGETISNGLYFNITF